MILKFSKYHGTGNDFVLIDGIHQYPDLVLTPEQVKHLCTRRFGVGADGLMILRPSDTADFYMDYYNADGHKSSMCGNGGRCIVQFAHTLDVIGHTTTFIAPDGLHSASILKNGEISLGMSPVLDIRQVGDDYELDTGSPHYIRLVQHIADIDIVALGRSIRYSDSYAQDGINVNAVQINDDLIKMQTYERGVEAETFSCGTGMVAAAMSVASHTDPSEGSKSYNIITKGGRASVSFIKSDNGTFHDVFLIGPAIEVFRAEISI